MADKISLTQLAKAVTAPIIAPIQTVAKAAGELYTKADIALGGILPGGVPVPPKKTTTTTTTKTPPQPQPTSTTKKTNGGKGGRGGGGRVTTGAATIPTTPTKTTVTITPIPQTKVAAPPMTKDYIAIDPLQGWKPQYQDGKVVAFSKGDKLLPADVAKDPKTGQFRPYDIKPGTLYTGKTGGIVEITKTLSGDELRIRTLTVDTGRNISYEINQPRQTITYTSHLPPEGRDYNKYFQDLAQSNVSKLSTTATSQQVDDAIKNARDTTDALAKKEGINLSWGQLPTTPTAAPAPIPTPTGPPVYYGGTPKTVTIYEKGKEPYEIPYEPPSAESEKIMEQMAEKLAEQYREKEKAGYVPPGDIYGFYGKKPSPTFQVQTIDTGAGRYGTLQVGGGGEILISKPGVMGGPVTEDKTKEFIQFLGATLFPGPALGYVAVAKHKKEIKEAAPIIAAAAFPQFIPAALKAIETYGQIEEAKTAAERKLVQEGWEHVIEPSAKAYLNFQTETEKRLIESGVLTVKQLKEAGITTVKQLKEAGITTTKQLRDAGIQTLDQLKAAGITTEAQLRQAGIQTAEQLKMAKEQFAPIVKYGKWVVPELWLPEYAMYKGAKAIAPYAKWTSPDYLMYRGAKAAYPYLKEGATAAYPYVKTGAELYFKAEADKLSMMLNPIGTTQKVITMGYRLGERIEPYAETAVKYGKWVAPELWLPEYALYKGAKAAYPYARTGADLYFKSEAAKLAMQVELAKKGITAAKEGIQFIKPYAETAVKYGKWAVPELWLPEYALYKGGKAAAPYIWSGAKYVGRETKESVKEQLKYMKILREYTAALNNDEKMKRWQEKWTPEERAKAPFQPWSIAFGHTQLMAVSGGITDIKKGAAWAYSKTVGPTITKAFTYEPDYYMTKEGKHIWASELKGKAPPEGAVGYRLEKPSFWESEIGYDVVPTEYLDKEKVKEKSYKGALDVLSTAEWFLPAKWGITAAEYGPQIASTLIEEGPRETWKQYGFEIVGLGTQAVSGLKYKPKEIEVGRIRAWINNSIYKPLYGAKALKVGQTITTQAKVVPTAVQKWMLFSVTPPGKAFNVGLSEGYRKRIQAEEDLKFAIPELNVYREEMQSGFDRNYKADIISGKISYEDAANKYMESEQYKKIMDDMVKEANRRQSWKSGAKILKLKILDFLTPETPGQVLAAGALGSTILSPTGLLKATGYVQGNAYGRIASFGLEAYIAKKELTKAFSPILPKEERIPGALFGTMGLIGATAEAYKGARWLTGVAFPSGKFGTALVPSGIEQKGIGIAQRTGVKEIPSKSISSKIKIGNEKLVIKNLSKLQRDKLNQVLSRVSAGEKLTQKELDTLSSAYGTRVSVILKYDGKILQGRDVKSLSWGNPGGAIEFKKYPQLKGGVLTGGTLNNPRKATIKEIVEELGYIKKVNGKKVYTVPKNLIPSASDLKYEGFFAGIRNHMIYSYDLNTAQYKAIKASSDVNKFKLIKASEITAGTQSAMFPLKRAPQTISEWGKYLITRGGGLYDADSAQIVQKFVNEMPKVNAQITSMSAAEKTKILPEAQSWISKTYGKQFVAKFPGDQAIQEYLLSKTGSAGARIPYLSTGPITDYFESAAGRTMFVERVPKGELGAGQFKRFETKMLKAQIPTEPVKVSPYKYALQLKKEGKINIYYDPYLKEGIGAEAAFAYPNKYVPKIINKPTLIIDSSFKGKENTKLLQNIIGHELTHYKQEQILGPTGMNVLQTVEGIIPYKYKPSEIIANIGAKRAVKTGYESMAGLPITTPVKVWQGPVFLGPGSEYKFGAPVALSYVTGAKEEYAHGAPSAIPTFGQTFTVRKGGLYFQPPVYPKGPYYVGISYLGMGPAEPERFALSYGLRTPSIYLQTEKSPTTIIPRKIAGVLTTTPKSTGQELEVIAPESTRFRLLTKWFGAPSIPFGSTGVKVRYIKMAPTGYAPTLSEEIGGAISTVGETISEIPIFQPMESLTAAKTLISPSVVTSEAALLLPSYDQERRERPVFVPSTEEVSSKEPRFIASYAPTVTEETYAPPSRGTTKKEIRPPTEEEEIIETRITPSVGPSLISRPTPPSTETSFGTLELPSFDWTLYRKKKKKKIKRAKAYEVLVRKRGKYKPLTPYAYPKEEAIAIGAKEVLATARATFKIIPSKKPVRETGRRISPLVLQKFFRRPKRPEEGVFIQRAERRITTPGEKREITRVGITTRVARQSLGLPPRKSKGLSLSTPFTSKSKSKFKFI